MSLSVSPLDSHVHQYTVQPIIEALNYFSFLGVSTNIVKIQALDAALIITDALNLNLSLSKLLIAIFALYPLAAILYHIPNKKLKHIYSIFVGLFLLQWIYGPNWIHFIISPFVTYILCIITPPRYVGTIVYIWAMGYLLVTHFYRFFSISEYFSVDYCGALMVQTMKLTSFGYNLFDGTYDYKRLSDESSKLKNKPQEKGALKALQIRKNYAILKLPDFIEFCGYVFCFSSLLLEPYFEFTEYIGSINETKFIVNQIDPVTKEKVKTIKKPSPILASLHRLALGVAAITTHVFLIRLFPLSYFFSFEISRNHNIITRHLYLGLAMFAERLKFYYHSKISEGANIMAGFGFEGYTSELQPIGWRGIENLDLLSFEGGTNIQSYTRNWNKSTQRWLERYTYHRTGKSLFLTYLTSSLWHGINPGYFLLFLTFPLLTRIERLMKKIDSLLDILLTSDNPILLFDIVY